MLRHVVPGLSHHDDENYIKQPSTPKTGSQLSRSQHHDPPDMYPLEGLRSNGSQDGLKENAAECFQQEEYGKHPRHSSKLTTAISGGKVPGNVDSDARSSEESIGLGCHGEETECAGD